MSTYDSLYALAKEIDANLHNMVGAGRDAAAQQYRQPIDNGMGTVTVSGAGHLLAVDLDPRYLRRANGRALGAKVARAIREAEIVAKSAREQQIFGVRDDVI